MKKVVVTIPSLLQGVLSFTASRRSFSLSRVSKLGSVHGSQDIQSPKRAVLDVNKFLNDCEKKALSANKMVIGPSNALATANKCTAIAEEVLVPTASIVPELLSLICKDAGVEKHVSLLRDVSFSAGWPVAGMWIQVNGLADVYSCGSPAHGPLEPSLFTSAEKEIVTLHSGTPETRHLELYPAKDCALNSSCVPVLNFGPAVRFSIQDSQALLHCAATMINQIVASNSSECRTGYAILTDGRTWRFVALQLNTLELDAAINVPGAVKNAAWVYENQLYTVTGDDIIVNPEVLGILHHIFNMDKAN
eukprot:gene10789-12584_t